MQYHNHLMTSVKIICRSSYSLPYTRFIKQTLLIVILKRINFKTYMCVAANQLMSVSKCAPLQTFDNLTLPYLRI